MYKVAFVNAYPKQTPLQILIIKVVTPQPRLMYLLASSRCTRRETRPHKTIHDYMASTGCSSEDVSEDPASRG